MIFHAKTTITGTKDGVWGLSGQGEGCGFENFASHFGALKKIDIKNQINGVEILCSGAEQKIKNGVSKMTVKEIQTIAKRMGLKAGKMKKADLVLSIQTAEGNTPCFQTGEANFCAQENCLWRADCN